jgi:hypothetical protein
MHVPVGIRMVERQTGRAERLELRANLLRKLLPHLRQAEKPHPCAPQVAIELIPLANEPPDLFLRQNGTTIDQDQMQADVQIRTPAGACHCIGGSSPSDHQARGRKDSIPMRFFDGLVDGKVEPEIIGADDQPPQLAISRLRRN